MTCPCNKDGVCTCTQNQNCGCGTDCTCEKCKTHMQENKHSENYACLKSAEGCQCGESCKC